MTLRKSKKAKRGRPRTTGIRSWPTITSRIPPDLLAALHETARVTESTINQTVVDALEAHCGPLLEIHRAVSSLAPTTQPAE